jgi:formamidopyrimidine-DNA glycosylase
MPELPEVETNARNFARWALGRRIVRVTPPPGAREADGLSPRAFRARLQGRRVESVERRGKWTLARLSEGGGLALHLGMTGKLARVGARGPLPRFTRAVFALDDGARVCFVDSRRFGRLCAAPWQELVARREVAELGPDALTSATPAVLARAFQATGRTVKEALMDQRVLAGVGNLYATEALWRAKIHPAAKAARVAQDRAALRRLASAVKASLRHGLAELEGAEMPQYLEDGAPNPFHTYDRAGAPCHRCGTLLRAMTIGGRTSAYCPRCQLHPAGAPPAGARHRRRDGPARKGT